MSEEADIEALEAELTAEVETFLADVTPETQLVLLRQKLTLWRNTLADAKIEYSVALVAGMEVGCQLLYTSSVNHPFKERPWKCN